MNYYGRIKLDSKEEILLMLSKPKSGWTNFMLPGTSTYRLSYLDDIPINWLDDAIHGLEGYRPFCVSGNMEPEYFLCVVDYDCCKILIDSDEEIDSNRIEISETSMLDFCNQLCEDISQYIDEWANFVDYNGENPSKKKRELSRKIAKLKKIIEKKEAYFKGISAKCN